MAELAHLILRQVGKPSPRRKVKAPPPPARNRPSHAKKLSQEADNLVSQYQKTLPPDVVDPSLIIKINLHSSGSVEEKEWGKNNLKILSHSDDGTLVLFSSEDDLSTFRARLNAYKAGPAGNNKHPSYSNVFDNIDAIDKLLPIDRIGPKLKSNGYTTAQSFNSDQDQILDVEIWRPENDMVDVSINKIVSFIEKNGGELIDEYRGPTGLLLRVKAIETVFGHLIKHPDIAEIDYPPNIDLEEAENPDIGVQELPDIIPPPQGAPCIGIIDSGVNKEHPLLASVIVDAYGEVGLPDYDENGHGTSVASILAYGDIRGHLSSPQMQARFHIASARVVNEHGQFPDLALAPKLIENAIRRLHTQFGCRIINISLNDPKSQVTQKGTLWSETLDTLARELDILLIISAGNSDRTMLENDFGNRLPQAYPEYLFSDKNRILDPAGAVNAITVGSIAHVNGLDHSDIDKVTSLPIAKQNEPSPFTRCGTGLNGAIKPDFVDYGGTAIFNGMSQKIEDGKSKASTGILTAHHKPLDRLFSTVSGTSFAAPTLAWKAAVLLETYPDQPASFYRALLGLSANIPQESLVLFKTNRKDMKDKLPVLGYGNADILKAIASDDHRVVLYLNSEISIDNFHIYEIPIPANYQTTDGTRTIDISLAFAPPVRRSRKDYSGISMEFDVIRGSNTHDVFEAFRKLSKDENIEDVKLAARFKCKTEPGQNIRKRGTLQRAQFTMKRNISEYGDTYYLVVRCLGKWAKNDVTKIPFTISTMLTHEARVPLYNQLKIKLGIRS